MIPDPTTVVLIERALPRLPARRLPNHKPLPQHALLIDVVRGRPDGGPAVFGRYLFRGPQPDERVEGWLLGPAGQADWAPPPRTGTVLDLDTFLRNRVYRSCYGAPRAVLAAFGLAGGLSSLASSWDRTRDGRSEKLILFPYREGPQAGKPNRHRPAIRVTPTDAGEVFRWTGRKGANRTDYEIDEWGRRRQYRGRFLDLSQAVHVASGQTSPTLAEACLLFDLPAVPDPAETPEDLLLRMSVLEQLYDRVLAEFGRWPRAPYLAPDKALTPSALGRSVRAAARTPQPLLDPEPGCRRALAAAMHTAGVGARSQVQILRTPVPVAHVDGTSHYPLASALIEAERLVTHQVTVTHLADHAGLGELGRLVDACTTDRLLGDAAVWPQLRFVARVRTDGTPWTLRVEHDGGVAHTVTAPVVGDSYAWVSGYDCARARIVTGRRPEILEAYLWSTGQPHSGQRPVELLDGWTYDPTGTLTGLHVRHDLGLLLAEERARLADDPTVSHAERTRRRGALKVAVNSVVYGSAAQLDPERRRKHTVDTAEGPITVDAPAERPGAYCNPAQAAFVCSAGRLLTGLQIQLLEERGWAWAWCDTDAVAIVCQDGGGPVPCRGGPHRDENGVACVKALDWSDVDELLRAFRPLAAAVGFPIPTQRVGGPSLFKLEDTALLPDDPTQIDPTPAWNVSVGQKRYAISRRDEDDPPIFDARAKPSNHGIGNLANPSALSRRDFTVACWTHIHRVLDGDARARPDDPAWLDLPALRMYVARYPGSLHEQTPGATRLADEGIHLNRAFPDARPYDRFLVATRSLHRGAPLVARYTPNPNEWLDLDWRDGETGTPVRITTRSLLDTGYDGSIPHTPSGKRALPVASVRAYLHRYALHTEPFTLDPSGAACTAHTRGLVAPEPIRIVAGRYTGRELGRVPERQAGLAPEDARPVVYHDDPTLIAVALERLPRTEAGLRDLGLAPRTVRAARAGRILRQASADRILATAPTSASYAGAATCAKPGCTRTVTGRRRWCPTHAQASSLTKARWRFAKADEDVAPA